MRLGFIGFGTMGQPMVEHLLKAGHELRVWSRRAASADFAVALGALRCAAVAEVASGSEIVCTNVTANADVAGLADALRPALARGAIHLDFSTIAPGVAKTIAVAHAECGVDFVDAPVSGGGVGARNATLAIMWGGREELAPRLAPIFSALGKSAVRIGEAGAGQVAKACNQMILVNLIEACAEAAALAAAAGVDFTLVREAMLGGSAGSRALEVFGARMATRDFAAGVEARLHHKDYALLTDEATRIGAPLPVSATVWQQLNALMARGLGTQDTSSLLRVLETVRPESAR
ncbi:MAG: NAD(P)-dependent oxidoreductase [Rhodocyclales bacterium]|nr:NAD(P)-dependent oxidoreductase [Rhodocyclales bacterium]